jgi:GH25 family lysozyme M1 (1,4-beta-N-acetylmuramidase)
MEVEERFNEHFNRMEADFGKLCQNRAKVPLDVLQGRYAKAYNHLVEDLKQHIRDYIDDMAVLKYPRSDSAGSQKANEWLEIVEKKCRVKAIIYTNMHLYATRIKNDPSLNAHDLWLAKPRGEMPDVPNCKFWQFTHEGHVWGIIDNVVDINMFNGTQEQLDEYVQKNGIKGNQV